MQPPELGYWLARAFPPTRLPVFVMGMLAARQSELEATDSQLRRRYERSRCTPALCLLAWALVVLSGVSS